MSGYDYSEQVLREVERMARLALPNGTVLKRATLEEDFGGVDGQLIANYHCPIQFRCRFNRPAYAADSDVTFRETEPAMMAASTYAPLALFLWFRDGYAEAGKLVDVYRMNGEIEPPFLFREVHPNRDGGRGFYVVTIAELHTTRALLMQGGRDRWAPARLGGERDTVAILRKAAAA